MFRYFLTFLLVNTCYQSLGSPLHPTRQKLIANSLSTLASQCENHLLADILKSKIEDCTIHVPPYSKKQFQCLILYDISTQLCTAVASAKLAITKDSLLKINEKQDVNAVCAQAKEWVFTNITEYVNYKESAENVFKLPATCGEVCGVEETMTEANYYCKYYKWGLEMLKSQPVSTMANNANNNAVAAPVITEPDFNAKADIPVPINSNPINTQETKTKTYNGQIKQTETAAAKTTPQKIESAADEEVAKSETAAQATSKQTPNVEENADKIDESDVNVNRVDEPVAAAPDSVIPSSDVLNKSKTVTEEKPAIVDDPLLPEAGKDMSAQIDQKLVPVIDNPKPKAGADAEEYDSDGNDNVGDDDAEDPGMEIKSEQDVGNQNNFIRNNLVAPVSHESDASQKESYFPNSMPDGFSDEDNDHFFPFFMTSVVLMVLLYVLYHNKSKVSKVFFGLILEGRQSGRRRNSRGHAYRRLDTLEQAMSANTAAPPSKIIY
uniref:Uncharacterized protein n=1 Tax=Heliothis virescens TaxID=7102 RepID=A0A2A4IWM8_HELVI